MNNSFEQLDRHQRNLKYLIPHNQQNKKQIKSNSQKFKYPSYTCTDSNNQLQSFYSSVISNSSLIKHPSKLNNSKSNQKKNKKDQSLSQKINKPNSAFKKCSTIQLTKKQKQIRQAIEYRYEKSKLKNYKISHNFTTKFTPEQDSQVRQFLDLEQQEKFAEVYSSLNELKTVNLYEYHQNKHLLFNKPQKQKTHNKIIVIKNNKKKRQKSESLIDLAYAQNQMKINSKYFAEHNHGYFSNKNNINLKSERNNLESAHHSRNKSEFSSEKCFKLQFLKNYKTFSKQKSGSRSKILKTQHSNYESQTGMKDKKQKIYLSSSVEKNFKSIKDIYLNALSNLANKNTVKTNKMVKNNLESKNKGSKGFLQGSEKKSSKNDLKNSLRNDKIVSNQHSSSLIHPTNNYFSCVSTREQNFKDSCKNNSFYSNNNGKQTKQKLEKTLLISEANPAQWKSIILKVQKEDNQSEEERKKKKNFKRKTKDQGFSINLCKNPKNVIIHPQSHRQYTKSPKYKRFIIAEQEQYISARPQHFIPTNNEKIRLIKNIENVSNQNKKLRK